MHHVVMLPRIELCADADFERREARSLQEEGPCRAKQIGEVSRNRQFIVVDEALSAKNFRPTLMRGYAKLPTCRAAVLTSTCDASRSASRTSTAMSLGRLTSLPPMYEVSTGLT